jgi:phosphatidate cytidylyltransferase
VLMLATIAIRGRADLGFVAVAGLFAVVWTTDILGYFVGRAVGGPKLAPSISPAKTWSGAVAGALGSIVVILAIAAATGSMSYRPAAILALLLSIAAQAGDLFESKIKRLFRAKDASNLLPGHGGVMDRLDGFTAAAGALALFMALRAWADPSAQGFVLW